MCELAQAAKSILRCGTLVLFKIASESPVSMAACAGQTEGCRRPYAQAHTFLNPALQGLEPNLQLLRTRLWNLEVTPAGLCGQTATTSPLTSISQTPLSVSLQTRGNLCFTHLQVGFSFLALRPSLLQLLRRLPRDRVVCKSSWAACDEFVGEAKAKGPQVHSFVRLSPAGVQQLHLRRLAVENVNRLDAIPLHSAVVSRSGNGTHSKACESTENRLLARCYHMPARSVSRWLHQSDRARQHSNDVRRHLPVIAENTQTRRERDRERERESEGARGGKGRRERERERERSKRRKNFNIPQLGPVPPRS